MQNSTNIKVIEKIGSESGKTVVLIAGVHGNEFCGVKAFDNLIDKLKIKRGKVFFVYANLEAIKQNKRFIEKNLNRCFTKNQSADISGTLEGNTALEIIPYLDNADLILDIHASNTPDSIPFTISSEKNIENARILNADIIITNFDNFYSDSSAYYCNKLDKEAYGFECGYSQDPKTEIIAMEAIINFLVYTKSIDGKLKIDKKPKLLCANKIYKNNKQFKLHRYFKDFEKIKKDEIIGTDGKTEIKNEEESYILFARNSEQSNSECFLLAKEH